MKTWKQFLKYTKDFTAIGGWLKNHDKIDTRQERKQFWKGLHSRFQHRVETLLTMADPTRSLKDPFTIEEIRKTAETLLNADRFDKEDIDDDDLSDSSSSKSSSSTESETESDTEDEDDKAVMKSIRNKKVSKRELSDTKSTPKKTNSTETTTGISDLVSKMRCQASKWNMNL